MPSIPQLILKDMKDLIGGVMPLFTFKVRKALEVLDGDAGQLPLCILIPDTQVNEDEAFEGDLIRTYRTQVALIWAGNMELETNIGDMTGALSSIPKALNITALASAPTVFDSTIDFSPTYDKQAIPRLYDHSVMDVFYLSSESRN